jgi:hypothetical protein
MNKLTRHTSITKLFCERQQERVLKMYLFCNLPTYILRDGPMFWGGGALGEDG